MIMIKLKGAFSVLKKRSRSSIPLKLVPSYRYGKGRRESLLWSKGWIRLGYWPRHNERQLILELEKN
jgi:hypothetical protein